MGYVRIYPSGVTIPADSPAYADVAAAVALASPGDTVSVPAGTGSATWTSTLALTRGVHLQGPGRDLLTITSDSMMIFIEPSVTALTNHETFRVTGFTFDGNETITEPYIRVDALPVSYTFHNLAIGACRFKDSGAMTMAAIRVTGQVRGAIYGNAFDMVDWPFAVFGGDSITTWETHGPNRAYGTSDNLFFEDNTIEYSSAFNKNFDMWTETGQGSRIVMRYNTWDVTNTPNQEFHDLHGMQNWHDTYPGDPQTGNLITEHYGNTYVAVSNLARWLNLRGGWGLIFNNILTGKSEAMEVENLRGCDHATGHPGQIANTYFWNNTTDGDENAPTSLDDCTLTPETYAGCTIKPLGLNAATGDNSVSAYYFYNAAFNGTSQHGIGRGTNISSAPASCSNPPHADANSQQIDGDAYWVASTATASVNPTIVQAGKLYKWIGGAWTQYYAPYTYPHPLAT